MTFHLLPHLNILEILLLAIIYIYLIKNTAGMDSNGHFLAGTVDSNPISVDVVDTKAGEVLFYLFFKIVL